MSRLRSVFFIFRHLYISRSVHLLAQVIGLISQVTHGLGAVGGLDTQRGPSGHYLPLQKDADIFMCGFGKFILCIMHACMPVCSLIAQTVLYRLC